MTARDCLMACLAALALAACDDGDSDPADAAAADATAADAMPDAADDLDAAPDMAADAAPDMAADLALAPDATLDPDGGAGFAYATCADADRVGVFRVELAEGFTGVQGQVADGQNPAQIPDVHAIAGDCRLLRPPELFCDPGCVGGTTCAADGTCVAIPSNVDVGAVTVTGLRAPVRMTASAPVWFYTNRDPLPHPGFDPGDAITLAAEGNAGDAFTLRGEGIAPLVVDGETLALEASTDATLRWTPPPGPTAARIHLDVNIANHGGTPARIECETADDGEATIPAELVDTLLGLGFSGFPTVVVTRRTVDAVDVTLGCVELRVLSSRVLDVEIPGLVSCGGDEDCPEGQTCQPDLTCA